MPDVGLSSVRVGLLCTGIACYVLVICMFTNCMSSATKRRQDTSQVLVLSLCTVLLATD